MSKLKFKLGTFCKILSFIFFIAIVVSIILYLLIKLFVFKESLYISSAIGAFMGAFAAYFITIVSSYINKILKRIEIGYIALFKLQNILNTYISINSDNMNEFNYAIEKFEKEKVFFIFNISKFDIHAEIEHEINYMELLNDFFCLNINLQKFNRSTEMIIKSYDNFKNMFQSRQSSEETYLREVKNFVPKIKDLNKFCKLLDEEFIDILTAVRVLLKIKRPLFVYFITKNYPSDFTTKVQEEKKKLLVEIEDIEQESDNELKKHKIK